MKTQEQNRTLYNALVGMLKIIETENEDFYNRHIETINNAIQAVKISTIDFTSLEVDDVFSYDYPDFADAYFSYGEHYDGTPLNEKELDKLTQLCPTLLNEMAFNKFI